MNLKICGVVMGAVIMGMLIAGCGNQQETDGNTEANQNNTDETVQETENTEKSDYTIYGKVTAIEGNRITIQVGNMVGGRFGGSGNRPDRQGPPEGIDQPDLPEQPDASDKPNPFERPNEGGNPPNFPDGEGSPPNLPDGEGNPDQTPPPMPEGSDGKSQRGGMFEETGETREITIEDENIINKRNGRDITEGTLADIEEGVILMITYQQEDSETIDGVSIVTMQGRPVQDEGTQNDGQNTEI